MQRFIIQAAHEPEECLQCLDSVLRAGAHYLTNTDWGCEDGVHMAWVVIEAQSRDDARMAVPPVLRERALLAGLNKFTPEQIRALHEQRAAQL